MRSDTPVHRGARSRRGVSLIELLLVGLLLCLFLVAAALLARRFVAPAYRPYLLGAGLLLVGAYLGVFIAQLRRLGRTASAWSNARRK